MAYREVRMWEILEVLRRIGRGENKSEVSRATGRGRRTIRNYVELAEELGWVAGLHEADETLALEVQRSLQPGGSGQEYGPAEALLLPQQTTITEWLKIGDDPKDGLKLTKIHELLGRQGVEVSYPSLHRFAIKHCGYEGRRRLTVRLDEVPPGEVAQVDFGRLGLIPTASGKRRTAYALVITLVNSRHQYVHVSHTQQLVDLLEGLEDAWEFFGGVPARVILDNLKAAVTKADRYEPVFQRTFDEYADYRGFVIDACVARSPTQKPHVERSVPYVRESLFKGEHWLDLAHLQRGAVHWVMNVAGTRAHGTTRQSPLAVFENVERAHLQPLLRDRFDPPTWRTDAKAHPDHTVIFEKALYTVPTKYVQRRALLDIRGDSKIVRIYHRGELIKTHKREPPGGKSIDHSDYPEHKRGYTMRDPERAIEEAQRRGPFIGEYAARLLEGDFPWSQLRQAQALLRLGTKYGNRRVDQGCRRALAFDVISVRRLERIIKHGAAEQPAARRGDSSEARSANVVQMPLRFQRPAGSFSHHQTHQGKEEHEGNRNSAIPQDGAQAAAPVTDAGDAAGPSGVRPEQETH